MKRQGFYIFCFFYCLQLLLMAKNKNFCMSKSFYFALKKNTTSTIGFLMKENNLFIATIRLILGCYSIF